MEVRVGRILVIYATNAESTAKEPGVKLKFYRLMKTTHWTSINARSWARL
jgi:hypothetical protein